MRRVTATAVLAVAALGVLSTTASAAAQTLPPSLETDATGTLFDLSDFAPGQSASTCVAVRAEGEVEPLVRLHAAASGPLTRYLRVAIEAGRGGGYADCADFAGSNVFTGTLADLATAHGQTSTSLRMPAAEAETFRFTVFLEDDPAAQGLAASATFIWSALAEDGSTISTPVSIDDDPAPQTTPPPPRTGGEQQRVATPDRARRRPTRPVGARGPVDQAEPAQEEAAAPKRTSAPTVREQLGRLLKEAAQRVAFPLAALAIILGFVAFQHLIDRKDPKLALAPVYADPDLPFQAPDVLREVAA